MCNPTTGSPTITLCQLRPNHYSVFNLPKNYILNYKKKYSLIKRGVD